MTRLSGHHTKEHSAKISVALKRAWKNPESRRKRRVSQLRFYEENPDVRRGEKNPFFGKHHTLAKLIYWSKIRKGVKPSLETRLLWSKNRRGDKNPFFGRKHSPATLRKILKVVNARPNKFESAVNDYINSRYSGSIWNYCGNGSVIINGHCPDFITNDGSKRVLLADGVYWHTKKYPDYTRSDIEVIESEPYKEAGYTVLFIWEDEFRKLVEGVNPLCSMP